LAAFERILQEQFRQIESLYAAARRDQIQVRESLLATFFFEAFQEHQSACGESNFPAFYEFMAYAFPRAQQSHSQIAQDLWVAYFMKEMSGGVFLEIGAGDGKYMSNTLMLERDFGWSGLLVEPNPELVVQLQSIRLAPCIQAPIWPRDGEDLEFQVASDAYLSRVGQDFAEDLHDRIGSRQIDKKISVKGRSFESICDQAELTSIDYVSLDVEGAELSILESIDLGKWQVPLWTIEHNWTDTSPRIYELMLNAGYNCWLPEFVRQDYFFYHPDWLANRLSGLKRSEM